MLANIPFVVRLLGLSCCWFLLTSPVLAQKAEGDDSALEQWIEICKRGLPTSPTECTPDRVEATARAADAIEKWAAVLAQYRDVNDAGGMIERVERLVAAKEAVDGLLNSLLGFRKQFIEVKTGPEQREMLRNYLSCTWLMIDLSGRMRYQLTDAINYVAYKLASQPEAREQLIERLIAHKSTSGAAILSYALFDPPGPTPNNAVAATTQAKLRILKLIEVTGQRHMTYRLADFVRDPSVAPELVVATARTLREIGLPQDQRPEDVDNGDVQPAITATELHEMLSQIPADQISSEVNQEREELLAWLARRMKMGLEEDSYRLEGYDVRPGDWLLMRNPSPYNLFTDLAPGLFTHVGIAAMETGSDGKRRMVIVDLPERGTSIPAMNVELYVQRTRHYMFVRHPNREVANKMGEVAASIIGNESEFDLNFRTDRVLDLKGQPKEDKKIKTYCAGLLLTCAQETPVPRDEFFPIEEYPAPGHTSENLAKLGLSVGDDFVSPTGALFSPVLEIAGWTPPLYDPSREVEEAVFDHFAQQLKSRVLVPTQNTFQLLRLKLAEAAKDNEPLRRAIAQAANINAGTDLVTAAKAAAVVETLDEVAYGCSDGFEAARRAIMSGPMDVLEQRLEKEDLDEIKQYRARHADLYERYRQRQLTPRQLRIELVNYYAAAGRKQLDQRFFGGK